MKAIKIGILWPTDPEFLEDADAIDAVSKFYILQSFGSSYTFDSLDNEQNRSILLLSACMRYYNTKMEMDSARTQFVSQEMIS